MQKFLLSFLFVLLFINSKAQKKLQVHQLSLPPEISYFNNQVSGLCIQNQRLYILSESRLQENAEPIVFTIKLADLDTKLADTAYMLPYQKLSITGLQALRSRMDAAGNNYEGLEAIIVKGNEVYLSVETFTPAPYAYLIKGKLMDNTILLDSSLLPIAKPLLNGKPVYNAGFEAITLFNYKLLALYEFNAFKDHPVYGGNAYAVDPSQFNKVQTAQPIKFLPFRITDITHLKGKKYTAINFFYKGGGGDMVYRVPAGSGYHALIYNGSEYINHLRLVTLTIKKNKIKWKPLAEFPFNYNGYNMEGIAAWRQGYLVINDKYTTDKPYLTTLVYVTLP